MYGRGRYHAETFFTARPYFNMSTYAIGDLQGCLDPLRRLLDTLNFDPAADRLWFVGDLVNRGPDSLAVLRFVKDLGDAATCVLGNHDLHLLARGAGFGRSRAGDTLDAVLEAPDRDALLDWLRHRPLAWREGGCLMVHAGVLPAWSADDVMARAAEAEAALRDAGYRDFFARMYGNAPAAWHDGLEGVDRLRVIVNALTRLRYCSAAGEMDFEDKGPPGTQAAGLMPWFDVPARRSAATTLVFGHWSTLGLIKRRELIALDTGCVWGSELTAVRLEDRALFATRCPEAQRPGAV